MTHPEVVWSPDPSYPPEARDKHLEGTTVLALTVRPDGSVENVQSVLEAGAGMDEAARAAVAAWKFKPAMCGSDPVITDIKVEVELRLR